MLQFISEQSVSIVAGCKLFEHSLWRWCLFFFAWSTSRPFVCFHLSFCTSLLGFCSSCTCILRGLSLRLKSKNKLSTCNFSSLYSMYLSWWLLGEFVYSTKYRYFLYFVITSSFLMTLIMILCWEIILRPPLANKGL